jgi:hypothetical protein
MPQRARVGLAALALGLQLAVLYVPRAPAIATGGLPVDKLVHVAVFALPTVALIGAGVPRGWVIGLMTVHAPLSEVVQDRFLAHRSGDPWDVAADLLGVAIGAFLTRHPSGARTGPGPKGAVAGRTVAGPKGAGPTVAGQTSRTGRPNGRTDVAGTDALTGRPDA